MRDALLRDLSTLPYQIVTTADIRVAIPTDCHTCHLIDADDDVWDHWEEVIASVDAVWLIAPETDGALAKLTALTLQYDKCIVGSDLTAIQTCSSKLATYDFLTKGGVNTIETFTLATWPKTSDVQWLAKPDDGAGCEQTVCFDDATALAQWIMQQQCEDTYVIQPYVAGTAGSISCVMHKGVAQILSCNKQLITLENNVLKYHGCIVNGLQQHWTSLETAANQIAQLFPTLTGYVGIDVIVNDERERITVIEINPRLTSSYIALQEAIGDNPAKLIMNTLTNESYHWPDLQRNTVAVEDVHA